MTKYDFERIYYFDSDFVSDGIIDGKKYVIVETENQTKYMYIFSDETESEIDKVYNITYI